MKGKREQTGDNDKIFRLGIGQGVHNSKLHLLNSDLANQRLHKKEIADAGRNTGEMK